MNLSTQQAITLLYFAVIFSLLSIVTLVFWSINRKKNDDYSALILLKIKSWWHIVLGIFVVAISPLWVGKIILCLVAILAFYEMVRIIAPKSNTRQFISIGIMLIFYQFIYSSQYILFYVTLPSITATALLYSAIKGNNTTKKLLTLSLFITGYLFSFTLLILTIDVRLFLFLITLTALNDVFQYTWGKLFGKHKILPKISPNKTWEGLIGGIVSITILANILSFFTPFTHIQLTIIGISISIAGFLGDALISAIKRTLKIKDTGTTIPGHGGIMDRLDSLVLTAPVFYIILILLS